MKSFPAVLAGIASTAIDFGAHWILLAWAERSFAFVAARKRAILKGCAAIAVIPSVSRFVVMHTRNPFAAVVHATSLVEGMIVVLAALPLLVLLGLSKLARKGPPIESIAVEPASAEALGRRGAIEAIGGTALLGATGLAFGWGMTVGRHGYVVREIPVRIPGLPKALDGYVIAQISDVHAGLFVGDREFREGADLLRSVRPDLVVATGDLVDYDPEHIRPFARVLGDLSPRDGVVAILGNHDYYAGHVAVSETVRAAGITLLVNDARILRPNDGGGFALGGLDDEWSERYGGPGPNLARTFASVPKDMARILLAHHPEAFDGSAGKVALQLSGHTHGGQIRPGNLVIRGPVAGRYDRNGSVLYVNRGFGVAGPPVRLGVPPEITKLVLVSA